MRRVLVLSLASAAALMLAACGGQEFGTREKPAPPQEVVTVESEFLRSIGRDQWAVAVLGTLRGEDAEELLLSEDQFNRPAPPGYEYLLVRVKVEPPGRGSTPTLGLRFGVVRDSGTSSDTATCGYTTVPHRFPWTDYQSEQFDGVVCFLVPFGEELLFVAQSATSLLSDDEKVRFELASAPLIQSIPTSTPRPTPTGPRPTLPPSIQEFGANAEATAAAWFSADGFGTFANPVPRFSSAEVDRASISTHEVVRGAAAWQVIGAAHDTNALPPSGYEYLMVYLEVGNPYSSRFRLDGIGEIRVGDEGGRQYGPCRVRDIPEGFPWLLDIPTYGSRSGYVCFVVPVGEEGLMLSIEPHLSWPSVDERMWFDLGL